MNSHSSDSITTKTITNLEFVLAIHRYSPQWYFSRALLILMDVGTDLLKFDYAQLLIEQFHRFVM